MDLILIVVVIAVLLVAIGGGYYLATHQHTLAMKAASALTRATTLPAGDVSALNAKLDNLGSQLNASTQALGEHVTATITAAVPTQAASLPPAPVAPSANAVQ